MGNPIPGVNYASMLPRWARQLNGRGACALPDAVATVVRSLLHFYPENVGRHLARGCEDCAEAAADPAPRWKRLSVSLPDTAAANEAPAHPLAVSA